MKYFLVIILFACFIGTFCEKISKYNEKYFNETSVVEPNLLYDNNTEHVRFVRHVEVAVTESIINHLMKKLKQRFPQVKKQPKSLNKMMKNLKQRLNEYIRKKKPNRIRPTTIHKNIRKKKPNRIRPTTIHKNIRKKKLNRIKPTTIHKNIRRKKAKRKRPTTIHKNIRKKLGERQNVTKVLRRKPEGQKLNVYD